MFFGRETRLADALEIIDRLRRRDGSRVLTLIASSGVGKSSFLRAGLWPRLARRSGVAPTVILRPGAGIMFGREGGLIHSLSYWFHRAGRMVSAGDLRSRFAGRSTPEGLASVLTEAAHAAGEGRTLILAIDHAEEIFDTSDQVRANEAQEFLDALLAFDPFLDRLHAQQRFVRHFQDSASAVPRVRSRACGDAIASARRVRSGSSARRGRVTQSGAERHLLRPRSDPMSPGPESGDA